MIFVNFMRFKPGVSRQQIEEATRRRAGWKYPQGVSLVGEFWLQGEPQVLAILEAADVAPVMLINHYWADLFDICTVPALTAEQALALLGLRRRRGRRPKVLRIPPPPVGSQGSP